jgi:DNA topoisomerase-1
MVVKAGRFGRFLACPGYPECNFTKPLVVEMPGRCPKCESRILKRTSKNGYTYYACEKFKECGFMTWDVPVKDNCPECGLTLFKKSGKGFKKPFCANEACPNFLPEDKRGYPKKPETQADDKTIAPEDKKSATKKAAAGKSKQKNTGEKKKAAKKTVLAGKK